MKTTMSLPFRNGVLETVGKEDFLPFEKEILVNGGKRNFDYDYD